MICPKCGGSLDRASPDGKWVAKKPRSQVDGYHISMLCSLINSLSGMWDRFKHAIDDPSKMQQFYNSDLGLPFDSMGSKVTVYMLNRCVDEGYRFVIKPDCAHVADDQHEGPCSMGIDVGGTFDVRISFVEPRGKRRAVYIGKVRNIDELHDLVGRYNVDRCVIDSMPEITLVQEFQEMAQCEVWLCRYRSEGTDRRRTYDLSGRIINIDRTEALDRSFAQMKRQVNVLPSNYEAILGGQYAAEMCDPIRNIVDTDGGKQKFEWTKGKDHQRHCDTYDMLAAQLMFESVISDIWVG